MAGENFTDHFTPNDRRELITTGVKLENLTNAVARLETAIATNALELGRRLDAFDGRLRVLENFRYWMLGGAAAVGALGGYFGGKLHP